MRFNQYDDVRRFHAEVAPVLGRDEAQTSVPLGILAAAVADGGTYGWRDPAGWLMATVADDDDTWLVALMTPPRNVLLYASGRADEAVRVLVDGLRGAGITVPGVTAEARLARRFAEAYTAVSHQSATVAMSQRIYELTSVNPDVRAVGSLRAARPADLAFLPYWYEAFLLDCGLSDSATVSAEREAYDDIVSDGGTYVQEVDGMPVASARKQAALARVCRVGYVYTPPYLRNHGYASACVAALSRLILDEGYGSCVLYTDLANPVSNSIYQRIGYRPYCDSLELRFEEPTP